MPERIQRRRVKGWRAPEGAINVTRPGKWGNPFIITNWGLCEGFGVFSARTRQELVDLYRAYIDRNPEFVARAREQLAGRDLMCWCPIGSPCHADVLLEIANPAEVLQ